LTLGEEQYKGRTERVTIDVVGWAFYWVERPVATGTSNTVETTEWDEITQVATQFYWGSRIGGILRRMLPRVEAITVRGYGPEAPSLSLTPLRDDGWLSLELHAGVYASMSEPEPTITLLENSGMHDDLWPSDGGCVSDKQEFQILSAAELRRRTHEGDLEAVGLGCLWRETIELMINAGRLIWATSYQSHEHLQAIINLRGVGAEIIYAFPNGFREKDEHGVVLNFVEPAGVLGEALRDHYPRPWGKSEALYAYTTAIWRHRVDVGNYEAAAVASRNRHVLAFRGMLSMKRIKQQAERHVAFEAYENRWRSLNTAAAVQRRLQDQACAAAELPTMPARQAEIVRSAWWCNGHERWPADTELQISAEVEASRVEATKEGVRLSAVDGKEEEAVAAFAKAVSIAPQDARTHITLGRYLLKLSRPASAIEHFYSGGGVDAEYFEEVATGVGTARAQQGRLRQSVSYFECAARINAADEKLRNAIMQTTHLAEAVEATTAGVVNVVDDVCGTPCQQVVDDSGIGVCAVSWVDGCGDVPPPVGFGPQSIVAELCAQTCALYAYQQSQLRP